MIIYKMVSKIDVALLSFIHEVWKIFMSSYADES